MSKLTFYRQRRMDGGTRTGIDIDEDLVLGEFEEGDAESDPRLLWFVDLRCEGRVPVRSARGARKWLLDHADLIVGGFRQLAEEMQAGLDLNEYPLSWDRFVDVPEGVRMKIVVSAIRRVDARQMAEVLHDISARWQDFLVL